MSGYQKVLIQRKKFTTTFTENDLSSVFSRDDKENRVSLYVHAARGEVCWRFITIRHLLPVC